MRTSYFGGVTYEGQDEGINNPLPDRTKDTSAARVDRVELVRFDLMFAQEATPITSILRGR